MKAIFILLLLIFAALASAQITDPEIVVLLNGAPVKPISKANTSILVEKGDRISFRIAKPVNKKYRFGKIQMQPLACTNAVNMPQRQYIEMGEPVAPTTDVISIERASVYSSSFTFPQLQYLVPDLSNRSIDEVVFKIYSVMTQNASGNGEEAVNFKGKKSYSFRPRKNCKTVIGGGGLGKTRGGI